MNEWMSEWMKERKSKERRIKNNDKKKMIKMKYVCMIYQQKCLSITKYYVFIKFRKRKEETRRKKYKILFVTGGSNKFTSYG